MIKPILTAEHDSSLIPIKTRIQTHLTILEAIERRLGTPSEKEDDLESARSVAHHLNNLQAIQKLSN